LATPSSASTSGEIHPPTPDFLSLVSHELSQPLTAARGSLQTLLRDPRPANLDERYEKLLMAVMDRNLAQLQALLDSLRSFSEVESGTMAIDKIKPVSVMVLFQDAVEDFGTPTSGTRIIVHCDDELKVNVDVTLFRQVLTNLIANALKFGMRGSVIDVTAYEQDDEVVFSVHNDGDGFAEEEAERIFDRSVRLQLGKRGLGLGLYVAKAIVRAHGGRIWGRSRPGSGASFFVAIPTPTREPVPVA
jgi:signal transduction histidine kinase